MLSPKDEAKNRVCPECESAFALSVRTRTYCSVKCEMRAIGRANKLREQARRWVPMVFERDGYRCALCAGKIDPKIADSHDPRFGVVDHVVPISCGGTSDPSNLQAAHHGCNSAKCNRRVGCQTRLFGFTDAGIAAP